MKKRILIAALIILGSLGVATVIRAQAVPITVSAGGAQSITLPTNSVTLTGTASSTNGSITTYAWTEVSGGAATIATPAAATTTVNNLLQGSYDFRLTVTDIANVSASSDVVITVNGAVANPVVNAGSIQTITLPVSAATLSGSATASSGRTISSYNWIQTSGPVTSVISTPGTATTSISGLTSVGNYVYTLTATDNTGAAGTGSVTITVNPTLASSTIYAGSDQTITLPVSTVTLSGSATAVTGRTITGYNWVQTSGPITSAIATPGAATTSVTGLTTSGNYVYTLTVTDDTGATGTASVTISVNAQNTNRQRKSQLEINPNGRVSLQGIILSSTNGVITTNVWGITFTINTTISTTNFLVGDFVQVSGIINPTASTPTITAKSIKDMTARVVVNDNKNYGRIYGYNQGVNSGNGSFGFLNNFGFGIFGNKNNKGGNK